MRAVLCGAVLASYDEAVAMGSPLGAFLRRVGRFVRHDGRDLREHHPVPDLCIRDLVAFEEWLLDARPGACAAAGQQVLTVVSLKRLHASSAGEGTAEPPVPNNPQGIFEAYWLYIEGLKPEGTPNSLICAQPMVVKDLAADVIKAEAGFQAPPTPGTYTLRVHILSTSVIGGFTVVEDDVPTLE